MTTTNRFVCSVWDTTTGTSTLTLNHTGTVRTLQFNESTIISSGDDRTVRLHAPHAPHARTSTYAGGGCDR
jgi:WD40 repeat protein